MWFGWRFQGREEHTLKAKLDQKSAVNSPHGTVTQACLDVMIGGTIRFNGEPILSHKMFGELFCFFSWDEVFQESRVLWLLG